jgi:hypothetical protein
MSDVEMNRNERDLHDHWLETMRLKRSAKALEGALSDAGLSVETMMASVIGNSLTARIAEILEELEKVGSDQPCL